MGKTELKMRFDSCTHTHTQKERTAEEKKIQRTKDSFKERKEDTRRRKKWRKREEIVWREKKREGDKRERKGRREREEERGGERERKRERGQEREGEERGSYHSYSKARHRDSWILSVNLRKPRMPRKSACRRRQSCSVRSSGVRYKIISAQFGIFVDTCTGRRRDSLLPRG